LVWAFTWRGAFVAAGATGFVWLAFWLWLYRKPEEHPRVSAAELACIQSDPPERLELVPYAKLLPCKETWAYGAPKFLTDGVWWFYAIWLPTYWRNTFHLKMEESSFPLMLAFGVSILGGLYGGYLPGRLIERGKSVGAARKTTLLVCAICV
jgi:ACS family hexuronate transporter-like MFS transporter